jgi:hypothetical protein
MQIARVDVNLNLKVILFLAVHLFSSNIFISTKYSYLNRIFLLFEEKKLILTTFCEHMSNTLGTAYSYIHNIVKETVSFQCSLVSRLENILFHKTTLKFVDKKNYFFVNPILANINRYYWHLFFYCFRYYYFTYLFISGSIKRVGEP